MVPESHGEAFPRHSRTTGTSIQPLPPDAAKRRPKATQAARVAGNAVVGIMPTQLAANRGMLLAQLVVPIALTPPIQAFKPPV